jgi:hypothetical protein
MARRSKIFILFLLVVTIFPGNVKAYQDFDHEEIFVDFRFQQLLNTTIIALSKDDVLYYPVGEILSSLLVFNNNDWSSQTISGYIGRAENTFTIDFRNLTYRYGRNSGVLTVDDFIIDQFDIYLTSDKFYEILNFQLDFNLALLSVRLITEEPVQIRLRMERILVRQRRQDFTGIIDFHPYHIQRKPRLINGGFVDYNLNFNTQNFQNQSSSLALTTGLEFLGGDLQSSINLNHSSQGTFGLDYGNTRWRYYSPNSIVKQTLIGNLQNNGITINLPVRGISFSNQPLYSRRVFDEYRIADSAAPYSEIEIFINDRLFEFFYVDEIGEYQISIPITYGINDIRIITYSPDGRIVETRQRLNVPFMFVPPREFYFNFQAGRTKTTLFDPDPYNTVNFDLAYGFNKRSTLRGKFELVDSPANNTYSFLSEYNHRFFDGLIGTFQYSPERLGSMNFSYQTRKNGFINLTASHFGSEYQRVNNGMKRRYAASSFFTLPISFLPTFFRSSFDFTQFEDLDSRAIDMSLTSRINRASISLGVRDAKRTAAFFTSNQTLFNYTFSYNTPRTQSFFAPFRGVFIRTQLTALDTPGNLDRINFAVSRNIMRIGQLQANYTHFRAMNSGAFFISFTMDFAALRLNSSLRGSSDRLVYNQSLRGSVGFFPQENIFLFDNRNQVGRSALVINSFIDTDNNGSFGSDEQILPYNTVRVQGAGVRTFIKKDRVIYTQLRQYERYNVEVNPAQVRDPSLVALNSSFSVTTDPNQFKYIQIPFSRTGIVEGFVNRIAGSRIDGVGGLNIRIFSENDSTLVSARTFFDGSFYREALVPGQYMAYPDSTQLQILGVRAEPAIYPFEIVASEFGDFVDIAFELYPLVPVEPSPDVAPEPAPPVIAPPVAVADPEPVVPPVSGLEPSQLYRVQIAMMPTLARAMIARERVERLLNHPAEITLSNHLNMYRVLTRDIDDLQTATQMLSIVSRETEHRDAYMLNSVNYLLSDVTYAVQIGAFRNSADADRHAEQARSRFGLDVHSFYHEISGWFVVQTREFTNWREAILLRDRIRSTTSYTDAFTSAKPPEFQIFSSYSVQVGAYAREEFARTQAQAFSRRTGMRFVVEYNPAARLYAVRVVDLNDLQQAETILRRLLEDYGFEEGIILSLERASGMN